MYKKFFIITLLLLISLRLTYIQISKNLTPLSLNSNGNAGDLISTRPGELLAGDRVTGRFYSSYSNLGVVSVRFYNQDRDSKDILIFKIKETETDDWYYQARYDTDQFLPHELFPFEFPSIINSSHKYYTFELESTKGKLGSGIFLDNKTPSFTVSSVFTKKDFMSNNQVLRYFLINKYLEITSDRNNLLTIISFFLPLFFYIVFLLVTGISYQILFGIVLLTSLIDVFYLNATYDYILLSTVFLWCLTVYRFRIDSKVSVFLSLCYLSFVPVFLISKENLIAEKFSNWAYMLLCVAVIEQVLILKKKSTNSLSLHSFIFNFRKLEISSNFWIKELPNASQNIINNFRHAFNQLKFDSLVQNYPKSKNFISILFITIPIFTKRLFVLCLKILLIFSTICLAAYFLIIPPFAAIYHVLPKFMAFFPGNYLSRYILTLVVPELFILLALIVLLNIIIKKRWIVAVLALILFNFISRPYMSKMINFESISRIINVSPSSTSEAWTDVVVTGKNFRNLPFTGKILINKVEQGAYLISWSDERIVFRTSPALTKSGDVQVIPLDRSPSNKVPFTYTYK